MFTPMISANDVNLNLYQTCEKVVSCRDAYSMICDLRSSRHLGHTPFGVTPVVSFHTLPLQKLVQQIARHRLVVQSRDRSETALFLHVASSLALEQTARLAHPSGQRECYVDYR